MSLTEAIFARPSYSQMERLITAEEVKNRIMSTYVGTPLVASTAAGMTDTDRIYVYVGSETGYTSGNWYYYDGSAWTSGGVYNSTAFETDDTLTIPDAAADSKAVGDEISDLKNALTAVEIVDTASGAIASFADGSDGVPVKGLTVSMEPIQAGSGDPSPTNIRPISGRDSVTVTRCGKNLINPALSPDGVRRVNNVTYENGDNEVTVTSTSNNDYSCIGIYYFLKAGTYAFKYSATSSDSFNPIITFYMSGGVAVKTNIPPNNEVSFTLSEDRVIEARMFVSTNGNGIVGRTVRFYNMQLELGSTATAYEPYQGDTYHITFPSEAGTVYGGTLDVTQGVLTVDRACVTLDGSNDELWGNYTSNYGGYRLEIPDSKIDGVPKVQLKSNIFVGADSRSVTYPIIMGIMETYLSPSDDKYVFFTTDITTKADWLTWLGNNNVELTYPLANPVTVQLTAQQLTTLLGQNNVWSDADSVSVDYVADTKLYIEQLTEPDSDMVADMNITSGRYFMVGNQLFLATANIANGAAIVVGVNCTRTNLAEALNAINS